MKKNTSFRLEEEQIEQLDKLVEHYKKQMIFTTNQPFIVQISKASVLEMLIREKFNDLVAEGKITEGV